MTPKQRLRLATIKDGRLANLVRVGEGEGFVIYVGTFDGEPAIIADSGTMADFSSEEDADLLDQLVEVEVFASEEARDAHLQSTGPARLGGAADF